MVCIYLIDIFIKNVKIMLFLTMEKVPESSKIKIHHVGDNMFYFENNNDPRLDSSGTPKWICSILDLSHLH